LPVILNEIDWLKWLGKLRSSKSFYLSIFAAARLTAASLTLPVFSLILPSVVFGEKCGMGFDKFLFSVSLRICWISPFFGLRHSFFR
jgi:hypothetical protein